MCPKEGHRPAPRRVSPQAYFLIQSLLLASHLFTSQLSSAVTLNYLQFPEYTLSSETLFSIFPPPWWRFFFVAYSCWPPWHYLILSSDWLLASYFAYEEPSASLFHIVLKWLIYWPDPLWVKTNLDTQLANSRCSENSSIEVSINKILLVFTYFSNFYPHLRICLLIAERKGGERDHHERETSVNCLPYAHDHGWNLQPWCLGLCSNQLSHHARVIKYFQW